MNVETANRLQNLRKKNGYSQEELAEKIGISRQAVSKWERAEASPDTDNLILLARLYGVTLDELLNTESIPMPNSEGISLSKDYYTSTSDDGEIYPEGHPRYSAPNSDAKPQNSANGAENVGNGAGNTANAAENVGNSEQKATVGDVVKAVANAVGDAIDTTAASIREGRENAPKDGSSDNGRSYADAFEKNFKGFGERMKTVGSDIEKNMNDVGKDIEQSVKKATDSSAPKFKTKPENIKYPATLLDKLYPIIVTAFFLFCAINSSWTTRYTWLVFLSVPVYYIFSQCVKNVTHGVYDPLHAFKAFFDGSLPIIIAFIYLALGLVVGTWIPTLFLFGLIPLYYIFSHNFFGWLDEKKSFGKSVKGFFDGSLPIIITVIYLMSGYFGNWTKALPLFAIIPIYYIVSSHFAKK